MLTVPHYYLALFNSHLLTRIHALKVPSMLIHQMQSLGRVGLPSKFLTLRNGGAYRPMYPDGGVLSPGTCEVTSEHSRMLRDHHFCKLKSI